MAVLEVAKRGKTTTKSSEVKRQLAALRKRGLTRAKPKGRPGGSAYATLRKLKPVIEGRAVPVKLTTAGKRMYKGMFPIAGGKAIVPVHKGERLSVSRKTGEINRIKTVGKRRFRFRMVPGQEAAVKNFKIPGDENTVYRITTKGGYVNYRFGSAAVEEFVSQYDVGVFVESIELVTEEDMEDA
jgi:hypothetical protein